MSDSQWPRFEVFHQDRTDGPHRNIGSVHAPDIEMALMNARDVFVRRPACFSLWLVPADEILAITEEEMRTSPISSGDDDEEDFPSEIFLVFQKSSQRRSMTYVTYTGQVEATSSAQAMAKAVEESMFEPAARKSYRHPREYKVVSAMHEIKSDTRDQESS